MLMMQMLSWSCRAMAGVRSISFVWRSLHFFLYRSRKSCRKHRTSQRGLDTLLWDISKRFCWLYLQIRSPTWLKKAKTSERKVRRLQTLR